MRTLKIRFGPVNDMTRKIYYKKIKVAKETSGSSNGVIKNKVPIVTEFSTDDDDQNTQQIHKNNGEPRRVKRKKDSPQKIVKPSK